MILLSTCLVALMIWRKFLGPIWRNNCFTLEKMFSIGWRVGWKIHDASASCFNRLNCRRRMTRKMVQDDQVTRLQSRNQEPVAKPGERWRINRTIEDHGSANSIQCDRLNKGAGLPLAAGNRFDQTRTSGGPAAESGEIRWRSQRYRLTLTCLPRTDPWIKRIWR